MNTVNASRKQPVQKSHIGRQKRLFPTTLCFAGNIKAFAGLRKTWNLLQKLNYSILCVDIGLLVASDVDSVLHISTCLASITSAVSLILNFPHLTCNLVGCSTLHPDGLHNAVRFATTLYSQCRKTVGLNQPLAFAQMNSISNDILWLDQGAVAGLGSWKMLINEVVASLQFQTSGLNCWYCSILCIFLFIYLFVNRQEVHSMNTHTHSAERRLIKTDNTERSTRHWSRWNHRVTNTFCNCIEDRTIGLQTHSTLWEPAYDIFVLRLLLDNT